MSKKIMSVMLAIFMLASLCVVGFTSASAANTGYVVPTVTGSGEVGAKAGDTVHVILRVGDLNGHYGVNGEINTYFDQTKLEFVKPTTPDAIKAIAPAVSSYMPNFNLDGAFMDGDGYMGVHINFSDINGYDYAAHEGIVVDYTFKALTDIENLNDAVYMDIVCLGIYDEAGLPMITGNYNYTNVATADLFKNYGTVSTNGGTWNPAEEPTTSEEPTVEIDVSALNALIAEAKALAEKDIYTAASVAALNDAIAASETVAAAPESQAQVDNQVAALQAAIDALELADTNEPTSSDATEEPTTTDATEEPTSTDATEEPTTTDATEAPTSSTTSSTTSATTEKPEAPQTGETSTAVALMVVAIMAAGVVIFARKKATK